RFARARVLDPRRIAVEDAVEPAVIVALEAEVLDAARRGARETERHVDRLAPRVRKPHALGARNESRDRLRDFDLELVLPGVHEPAVELPLHRLKDRPGRVAEEARPARGDVIDVFGAVPVPDPRSFAGGVASRAGVPS